jgi:hypothetical protein
MLKSSGHGVFKQRLNQGHVGQLSAVVVKLIGSLRTTKRLNNNLSRSFGQVIHDLKRLVFIRLSGYLSPLCTAPITITTNFI